MGIWLPWSVVSDIPCKTNPSSNIYTKPVSLTPSALNHHYRVVHRVSSCLPLISTRGLQSSHRTLDVASRLNGRSFTLSYGLIVSLVASAPSLANYQSTWKRPLSLPSCHCAISPTSRALRSTCPILLRPAGNTMHITCMVVVITKPNPTGGPMRYQRRQLIV